MIGVEMSIFDHNDDDPYESGLSFLGPGLALVSDDMILASDAKLLRSPL